MKKLGVLKLNIYFLGIEVARSTQVFFSLKAQRKYICANLQTHQSYPKPQTCKL